MDFSAKIRAARALLSWTREDLAGFADVSAPAIKNIETGASRPTATTQQRLTAAFEEQGIFFTADGLEQRRDRIRFLSDFADVLANADSTLRPGDEILLHCADERKNTPAITAQLRALEQRGIALRFTVSRGNKTMSTSPRNYRGIDPALVESAEVTLIFADKYVLHVVDEGRDIYLMIKNALLADVRRREFEYWWNTGESHV